MPSITAPIVRTSSALKSVSPAALKKRSDEDRSKAFGVHKPPKF
nr:hypothetical protein [uncultured Campylobacter sp.]